MAGSPCTVLAAAQRGGQPGRSGRQKQLDAFAIGLKVRQRALRLGSRAALARTHQRRHVHAAHLLRPGG
jgi:hypothetical protein